MASASHAHMAIDHDVVQTVSVEAVDLCDYPLDSSLTPTPATIRLWREKTTGAHRVEVTLSNSFYAYTVNPLDVSID